MYQCVRIVHLDVLSILYPHKSTACSFYVNWEAEKCEYCIFISSAFMHSCSISAFLQYWYNWPKWLDKEYGARGSAFAFQLIIAKLRQSSICIQGSTAPGICFFILKFLSNKIKFHYRVSTVSWQKYEKFHQTHL